jgi:class 3 adenylate cyclase
VSAQLSLTAFTWPVDAEVRVRMGLHTAEPHLGEDGYAGIGVHRAARICDAARGGQILVSNATAGIVEDAELEGVDLVDVGAHRLEGLPREQQLFQVVVQGVGEQFHRPRDAERSAAGAGTFFLADLHGSAALTRLLGDDAGAELMDRYQATLAEVVEADGGVVLERAGDGLLAVFMDASAAVRTAVGIREALVELEWPAEYGVKRTMAIHSGRWSGDPRRPAAGTAIVRLARIFELAEPGQVLVSQGAAALVEGDRSVPPLQDLGERVIPDLDRPERVYGLREA